MFGINITTTEFGVPILNVSHTDNVTLELDLMDFYRKRDDVSGMYKHADKYIRTLDPKVQKGIYDLINDVNMYNQTHNYSQKEAVEYLEKQLDIGIGLLDLDNWRLWFRKNSKKLFIPDTVQDTFVHDPDMGITEDKTYVTAEYIDLIGFITFLRALSPLYIEYLSYVKRISKHPYYLTYRLFMGSRIDNENTELHKLRLYIEANYQGLIGGSGKNEHLIISAGLSDDDIMDYLIAEVIFNKLIGIDFFMRECNAVSYIFQTIKYKGTFRTSESSKLRASSSRSSSEREDYSYFEDYRKTSSIPIGTVVEIQHALSDVEQLAMNLGYTDFNFDLYNKELKNLPKLVENRPDNVQIYLLGWFLYKVINPRALFHLENTKIVELLIFAKVALLDTNQAFIGIFLTSIRGEESEYMNIVIRNTLNRELIDELKPHFKYVMNDKKSIIEETISEIAKEMSNSVWTPVGSLGGTRGLITKEGYLDMSTSINDLVTSYVAYILKR